MREKKKRSSRRVTLSFAATVLVLTILALAGIALYPVGNGVTTKHVTGTIPSYSGLLGEFAPIDALQVSFNNLTAIRAINSTALPTGTYLTLVDPGMTVSVTSIEQRVSVAMASPNATVDITILAQGAFDDLRSALNRSLAPIAKVGPYPIYSTTAIVNKSSVQTLLAPLEGTRALLASSSVGSAKQAITKAISVFLGTRPSLLSNPDVRSLLYVANGTGGHLGVAIQNFVGVVTTGKMTLITVDDLGSILAINHFVKFANATEAGSQISYFTKVYIGDRFESYDDILVAIRPQPLSSLVEAVAAVG